MNASGSISHTATRVAAIVAPDEGWRVGIDLERRAGLKFDIAKRVLVVLHHVDAAQERLHRQAR